MNEWSLNDYLDDIGWTHGQTVTLPYFGEITFNADTGFHYYQSDNAERFRHDTCAGLIAGHTIQKG